MTPANFVAAYASINIGDRKTGNAGGPVDRLFGIGKRAVRIEQNCSHKAAISSNAWVFVHNEKSPLLRIYRIGE